MDTNEKIYEKIIVSGQDELVDVLKKIHASKADRLVLTFAEDTDLLVSPITFKVIIKECDELEKSVVAQIIQNNSGVSNARMADMVTTDLPTQVNEELWEGAEIDMRNRKRELSERLKSRHGKRVNDSESDTPVPTNSFSAKEPKDIDLQVKDIVEAETLPSAEVQIDMGTEPQGHLENISMNTIPGEPNGEPSNEFAQHKTTFEERISQALEKSRAEINKDKLVKNGSFVMALDKDIDDFTPKNEGLKQNSNSKFQSETESSKKENTNRSEDANSNTDEPRENRDFNIHEPEMSIPAQTLKPVKDSFFTKLKAKFNKKDTISTSKAFKNAENNNLENPKDEEEKEKPIIQRLLIGLFSNVSRLLIAILIVALIIAYFMYEMMPLAKVKIFIESKPISIEKLYVGEPGTVFNQDLATVGTKTEEVKKERSDTVKATGVDYKGTRAEGIVTLKCESAAGTINLPAGTIFTSGGLQFTLNNPVTAVCLAIVPNVALTASGVGEEYNLVAGAPGFSVAGQTSSVWADVSSNFTGGSKTPITILSQKDIDDSVNKLKEVTFKEASNQLKELKKSEGWVVIESTIKNELDGDIKTDVPVGSEVTTTNLVIKTKSSAEYYNKTDIEKTVNDQLMTAAKTQNLFKGLDQNGGTNDLKGVTSTITVDKLDGVKVTVKLIASAMAKPNVDSNEISKALNGKSWESGKTYLSTLKFVTKQSEVEFLPEWFPTFAWRFPTSQGRIIISVEEIPKVETATPSPSPATDTTTPATTTP